MIRILGISHLGIAPKNDQVSLDFFTRVLGLTNLGRTTVPSESTVTDFIASHHGYSEGATTNTRLEILTPDNNAGPIARFLESKGGGIHHVAFRVESIDTAISHLKSMGVRLISETARPGAHGSKVVFVHPHATGGILVEFVEETDTGI